MPIENDFEFLETFVGPCQHLRFQSFWPRDGSPPFWRCALRVTTQHGATYQCTRGRLMTAEEIKAAKNRRW